MRRAAPPGLRLDPAVGPAIARVAPGAQGLRLRPAENPPGSVAPMHDLRPAGGAPFRATWVEAVSAGRMALVGAAGIAASVTLPEVDVVHDRRPPELDAVVGAASANAGLVRVEGAWRALVLPSLGDLVADLGPGPVAIRADGRMVAAAADGAIVQRSVPDGTVVARVEGVADALCLTDTGDVLVAAAGLVGPPGTTPGDGPHVRALRAAADAPRAVSLDASDELAVWDTATATPILRVASPIAGARLGGLSADGELVALSGGAHGVSAVLRTSTGAVAAWIEGAHGVAVVPDGVLVCGEFGIVMLSRPKELS